jgi:hypothetical protein
MANDDTILSEAFFSVTDPTGSASSPAAAVFGSRMRSLSGRSVVLLPIRAGRQPANSGRRVLGAGIRVEAIVRPFFLRVKGRGHLSFARHVTTGDADFDRAFGTGTNSPELASRILDAPTRRALLVACAEPRIGEWLVAEHGSVTHCFPLPHAGLLLRRVVVDPAELRRRLEWTIAIADRIQAECDRIRASAPAPMPAPGHTSARLRPEQAWIIVLAAFAVLLVVVAISGAICFLFTHAPHR